MAGGNFLGRIISYVVNELVVEGLANNPSFQRFAVRTSKTLQDLSTKAEQTKQELTEQIREASKNFDVNPTLFFSLYCNSPSSRPSRDSNAMESIAAHPKLFKRKN
ncbi:hypothetical protein HPP92_021352 [Vanilla planifolia]|uniref:Uncharacterized protein n=1 Tax=Vanilla planifolia TaxID=51239 RepID=A0A835PYP2_VANPL|nr:hypothetical protein HPP92_021352 [Vanilla planifolia]